MKYERLGLNELEVGQTVNSLLKTVHQDHTSSPYRGNLTISDIISNPDEEDAHTIVYFEHGQDECGFSTRRAVYTDESDTNPEYQRAQITDDEVEYWVKFGTESGLDLFPYQDGSEGPSSSERAYYWVNQNRDVEFREGFLRSQDTKWQRDLTVLETGDIVFHYTNQAVRGWSTVTVPENKYTGRSYQLKKLSKTRVNATITFASVEDARETFSCFAEIETSQLGFEDTDAPLTGSSQQDGEPERCRAEIVASRDLSKYGISIEEAEQAIENGRAQAVLPPWDSLPGVTVTPKRTAECHGRYRESNGYIQDSAPKHKLGTLIDVRIK